MLSLETPVDFTTDQTNLLDQYPKVPIGSSAKMGIKHLFQIIKEEAPDAIKEGEIKAHFGRKVAIVSPVQLPSRFYAH